MQAKQARAVKNNRKTYSFLVASVWQMMAIAAISAVCNHRLKSSCEQSRTSSMRELHSSLAVEDANGIYIHTRIYR